MCQWVSASGVDVAPTADYIITITICLTPTSRGGVTVASSNLTDPPIININFNATEVDRYILCGGLKKTVSVMRGTESAQSFIDDEVPDGHTTVLPDSVAEVFDKRIREVCFSLKYPCGSCAMDKVVDFACKVGRVQGLRVVDKSICPIPIRRTLQVCVYLSAEKNPLR